MLHLLRIPIIFSVIIVAKLAAPPVSAAEPHALENQQLYLVFDPRLAATAENCDLKVHQFQRHPLNPLIKADADWERAGCWAPGAILWDEQSKLFKMWYDGGGPPKWEGWLCYATSKDGIHWEKPSLGRYEIAGSKDNNVCCTGVRSIVLFRNPDVADADKRYVMWAMQPNRYMHRFYSPDGLHWKQDSAQSVIPAAVDEYWTPTYPAEPNRPLVKLSQESGDVGYVFWFPRLGKHICFRKMSMSSGNAPYRRFVRFESADGIHWNFDSPTWALVPDKEDEKHDPLIEFYGLGIHSLGDLHLAFTQLYYPERGDFYTIGLAHSTDTVLWRRDFRGQPVLARSEPGEWDWGWTINAANTLEKDGMWWMYYGGIARTHEDKRRKNWKGEESWGIGLAQMPIGRVVSACCWRKSGVWTTGPVYLSGRALYINARIYERLRLTILDENDKPISSMESSMGHADGLELPVKFSAGRDISKLSNRPVKLRFEMTNAELFGFKCK